MKIKDMSDMLVSRDAGIEYTRIAMQLESALECYNGASRPRLLKEVAELRTSVAKHGIDTVDAQTRLARVKAVLNLVEIEADLRDKAGKTWAKEIGDAHVHEMMRSLAEDDCAQL
jgi:hypothetical protein